MKNDLKICLYSKWSQIYLIIPIIFPSLAKGFCVFVMMPKHLDDLHVKLYVKHDKISKPQYDVLVVVI